MATETLRPNAAGDECNVSTQNGCSACPNHYDCVDEVVADDATTTIMCFHNYFVRDLYNIADSAIGAGTINFIKVYVKCYCNNAPEQTTHKIAIKSGVGGGAPGVVSESGELTMAMAWILYSNQWNTNPATAAAWTWAEIDNLQAGIALRVPLASGGGASYCTQVYVEVDYTPYGVKPVARNVRA